MQYSKITSWLWLLGNLRPEMWDWIVPMGPVLSPSASKVGIALILKSLGNQTDHQEIGPRLIAVGRKLFVEGIEGLNYDDEPDICPVFPKIHFRHHGPDPGPDPWPIIHQLALLGPQPEPWRSFAGELNPQPLPPRATGLLLEQLAALVDHEGISRELAEMGGILARH